MHRNIAQRDGPAPEDDPMDACFTTPPQVESLRKMLGLSLAECGLLLGGVSLEEIRNLEKPQTKITYGGHEIVLKDMLERIDDLIGVAIDQLPEPPFLVTYRQDGHFTHFDPDLAKWMRFASAHRMFVGRVWWEAGGMGKNTTIVALHVDDYVGFLERGNLDDTRHARSVWASEYVGRYSHRDGLPLSSTDPEIAIAARASWSPDGVESKTVRRQRLAGEKSVI